LSALGEPNTPIPVRDNKFLMDWSCGESPIPVFGGPLPPLPGDEKEMSGLQILAMRLKRQKGNPCK